MNIANLGREEDIYAAVIFSEVLFVWGCAGQMRVAVLLAMFSFFAHLAGLVAFTVVKKVARIFSSCAC